MLSYSDATEATVVEQQLSNRLQQGYGGYYGEGTAYFTPITITVIKSNYDVPTCTCIYFR